jgi:hypothetical protein
LAGFASVVVGGLGRAGAADRFAETWTQRVRLFCPELRIQRGRRVLSQRLMLTSTDSDVVY